MIDPSFDVDQKLEQLRRATDELRPRADFADRVMQAVFVAKEPRMMTELWIAVKTFVPLAALVAAVGIGWAAQSEWALNEALATSFNTVEVE